MAEPLELIFYSSRPNGWDVVRQQITWSDQTYPVKVLSYHAHGEETLFKVEFSPGHWQMMLYTDLLYFTRLKTIDISMVPQGYSI